MSTLLETTQTDPSVLAEARALIKIADDDGFPARTFVGTDFFDPNCAVVLPEQGTTGADEHPFGSYNITYPYCRTAIRVAVDDPDPNPLLAQVTSSSRYLSIRVTALVCGVETRLAGFRLLDTASRRIPHLLRHQRGAPDQPAGLSGGRRVQGHTTAAGASAVGDGRW